MDPRFLTVPGVSPVSFSGTLPRVTDVQTWDGRNRGGMLLLRLVAVVIGLFGYRRVRLVALFIAWLVLWLAPGLRAEGWRYWHRLLPHASRRTLTGMAWRQLASFGSLCVDRVLVYRQGQSLALQEDGWHHLDAQVASGRGCVLVSAHMGSWELAGRLVTRFRGDIKIHLVKVANEDPRERALLDAHMGDIAPAIIDPRDPIAASVAIHAAVEAGGVVCMLGDRVFPGQPAVTVPFFGEPVRFPLGPWQVAALTGAPIITWFLMYRRPGVFRFEADPAFTIDLPRSRSARRRVLHEVIAAWARRLERQVRRYPLQWHNFFDFWRQ